MVDIIIVRSNPIVNSPRVIKLTSSLRKKYCVRVIGWNRTNTPPKYFRQLAADLDILKLRAPVGEFRLGIYMPLFWFYILAKLIKYRPQVVHACDLDTVPPVYLYKVLFRKKVVFDVCDRYAMSKIPRERTTLYSLVNRLEEFYASKVDCLINVSDRLEQTFQRKPKKSVIIMNCADDGYYNACESPTMKGVVCENMSAKFTDVSVLTLVYTGNIIRGRGIEQIAKALQGLKNVRLVIAGKVIDKDLLEKVSHLENAKYFGYVPLVEALELEKASDVMMILYDPHNINNMYAVPNKLFEAMMFSIPIITNVSRDIIEKTNCGVIVKYDDIEEIRNAVIILRDDRELRMRLGRNGRMAFENEYNWKRMEQTLHSTYQVLFMT